MCDMGCSQQLTFQNKMCAQRMQNQVHGRFRGSGNVPANSVHHPVKGLSHKERNLWSGSWPSEVSTWGIKEFGFGRGDDCKCRQADKLSSSEGETENST